MGLLPCATLALGGRIGDGTQYMSWITREDLVSALLHLVEAESVSGPVNLVSPGPVTNAEFTAVLGRVLARPTLLELARPRPALLVRARSGVPALLVRARSGVPAMRFSRRHWA